MSSISFVLAIFLKKVKLPEQISLSPVIMELWFYPEIFVEDHDLINDLINVHCVPRAVPCFAGSGNRKGLVVVLVFVVVVVVMVVITIIIIGEPIWTTILP